MRSVGETLELLVVTTMLPGRKLARRNDDTDYSWRRLKRQLFPGIGVPAGFGGGYAPGYSSYGFLPPGFIAADPNIGFNTQTATNVGLKGSLGWSSDNPFKRPFLFDGNFGVRPSSMFGFNLDPMGPYYLDPSAGYLQALSDYKGPPDYPRQLLGLPEGTGPAFAGPRPNGQQLSTSSLVSQQIPTGQGSATLNGNQFSDGLAVYQR